MQRRINIKKHFLLLGLLLFLFAITSCASVGNVGTDEYIAEGLWGELDWDLPVAVSVGIEPYQLKYLTDDEIRALHQPHVDIANAIAAEFNVGISIGTFDCYFMPREYILYAIANTPLAETDASLRELAEQLRRMEYSSKIIELVYEAGYFTMALFDAFDNGYLHPVDTYYRIHEIGITAFFEENQYILR